MVYPLIPLYVTGTLGAGPAVVGLIEGLSESVASLLKVVSGYVSDRLGDRKTVTIVGYAGSVVGKVCLALASTWGLVLTSRVVDRLGKGVRGAPRDALIAESAAASWRGRAFGVHRALDTTGAVIGVVLAYLVVTRGSGAFRQAFAWSIWPALAGVLLLFFVRTPPARQTGLRPHRPTFAWRRLPSRLRAFLGIALLFALGNSSNAFLLLRAQQVGYTAGEVILLYLTYNVVYALAAFPAGWVSDRIGRPAVLIVGYTLYGVVYVGVALAGPQHATWLWGLFGLCGLFMGLTEGVEKALVADLAPVDLRATGIGLHATLVGLGLLPASAVAGALWQRVGADSVFWLGGVTGFSAALLLLLLHIRREGLEIPRTTVVSA